MTEEQRLVRRALEGERGAVDELVVYLSPVIQARVTRALCKHRGSANSVREEARDLCQEVFGALFSERGRLLLDWDPARGSSLRNFVGLVATRHVLSALRSKRRDAWANELREPATLDRLSGVEAPEQRLVDRDELVKWLNRFQRQLSPLGIELFERLYVREQSTQEIQAECNLSADAVYQWRTRLRRLARQTLQAVEAEPSATLRTEQDAPEVPR